jgi:hypothetical protein
MNSGAQLDISAVLAANDGTLVGFPFPIFTGSFDQSYPSVAGDLNNNELGTGFAVVWHDAAGGGDIYGAHVSSIGVVGNRLRISSDVADEFAAEVSFSPKGAEPGYLVTWSRSSGGTGEDDVFAARIVLNNNNLSLDPAGAFAVNAEPKSQHWSCVGTYFTETGHKNLVAYSARIGLIYKLRANLINFNIP